MWAGGIGWQTLPKNEKGKGNGNVITIIKLGLQLFPRSRYFLSYSLFGVRMVFLQVINLSLKPMKRA